MVLVGEAPQERIQSLLFRLRQKSRFFPVSYSVPKSYVRIPFLESNEGAQSVVLASCASNTCAIPHLAWRPTDHLFETTDLV